MVNTSYFMYFAVLASMIHGLTIPGAIEVAQREKGFTKGLFEWLRKAPWGNPVFSGMFISLIGFGFLGGISGVMMGTEQLNMIIHNTIYVPGHFHATVVVGTTLSFMALTYFLIPVLFRREMINPGLAKLQPYLFGLSMYFFCLVMMGAGTLGVSRRHWDMAFSGVATGLRMAGRRLPDDGPGRHRRRRGHRRRRDLHLHHGRLAAVGQAARRRRNVSAKFTPIPRTRAQRRGAELRLGRASRRPAPSSLAMVFLVAFVLYYFINWKYLSQVWGLS